MSNSSNGAAPEKNPVAKNLNRFNRPATHRDRKKSDKAGEEKHKKDLRRSDEAG